MKMNMKDSAAWTAKCHTAPTPGDWRAMVFSRGPRTVKKLVEHLVMHPVQRQEISYVTWSPQGIRVAYSNAMVAFLSADDMYPLAVPVKVATLVATERGSMVPKLV
jgi:hypothetical protein